jgi:hypothetical protein
VKNDPDYVFTHFLVTDLPVGIAGLVLAAICGPISGLVSPLQPLAASAVMDPGVRSARRILRARSCSQRGSHARLGRAATSSAFLMGGSPIIETVNRIGLLYGTYSASSCSAGSCRTRSGRLDPLAGGLSTVLAVHFLYNERGLHPESGRGSSSCESPTASSPC